MNLNHIFRNIEKKNGVAYASEFYAFIDQFMTQVKSQNFDNLFKKFRFCTEEDVRIAIEDFAPDGFIPFFIEEHNGFEDYYCFERENAQNSNRVLVFSQDAIVFEWGSYADFLVWVQNKIGSL